MKRQPLSLQQSVSYKMKANGISLFSPVRATLMALLLLLTNSAQAGFDAILDQSIIASHETFELTLRSDTDSGSAPDLSPLQEDFEILGTRQSRQVRIINGQSESWRDWIVHTYAQADRGFANSFSGSGQRTLTAPEYQC